MSRWFIGIAFCLFAGSALAQTGLGRAFEVATVKPSAPDARATASAMPPGRLEIMNMTLRETMAKAYNIEPFQISGGPGWLDSVHYDISAKAAGNPKREDVLLMLQSLLADRFQLVFRREFRQLPVYALVMARKDGKLGPQLTPSKEGACIQFDPEKPFAVESMRLCGAFDLGPDGLTLVGGTIGSLAPHLSHLMGRTVIDKTGLTGKFDIHIEWSPDTDNSRPSIFTAFRDELGVEFKAERGPVEILVVERAEKPSAN